MQERTHAVTVSRSTRRPIVRLMILTISVRFRLCELLGRIIEGAITVVIIAVIVVISVAMVTAHTGRTRRTVVGTVRHTEVKRGQFYMSDMLNKIEFNSAK